MDTLAEPEYTEEFVEKQNSILAMWKRLWPLIISVGLFMLLGIANAGYNENGCPDTNFNLLYIVELTTWFAIPTLIISRLLPISGARRSLAAWFLYIIRTVLIVIGASTATFMSSILPIIQDPSLRISSILPITQDPSLRIIGVITWVGIAIVILVGRERKCPTRYQAFIWLSSLLLLIVTWYLADIIRSRLCIVSVHSLIGSDV